MNQPGSRWHAVRWAELPGFADDSLFEAWNAWLKSCEKPAAVFVALCPEVRRLSIANAPEQRAWMKSRLQPYRVESRDGRPEGLLTAYYEPLLLASRLPDAEHRVPLYGLPSGLATALGLHWEGALLAVILFGLWCGRLAVDRELIEDVI